MVTPSDVILPPLALGGLEEGRQIRCGLCGGNDLLVVATDATVFLRCYKRCEWRVIIMSLVALKGGGGKLEKMVPGASKLQMMVALEGQEESVGDWLKRH